jgi:hypothetical protein
MPLELSGGATHPSGPAPKAPGPPSHTDASSGGYNFSRVATYNRQVAQQPPTHTDVTSGGYDFSRANAFKQTPAYHQAVIDTFKAQSPKHQAVIVHGAQTNPTHEGQIIMQMLRGSAGGGFGPGPATIDPSAAIGSIRDAAAGFPAAVRGIDLSGLTKILGNAGKDLINLPGSTITGAGHLISSMAKDYGSGFLPNAGGVLHPTNTEAALGNAWNSSMTDRLVHGDLAGAWQRFVDHPIFSGSELTGAYGLAGRAAGAVGRSGLLGDTAARVASTARPAQELIPGVPGSSVVQHYSPNLMTKGIQYTRRNSSVGDRAATRLMAKQVDAFHQSESTAAQRALENTVHDIRAAKPKSSVTASAVPHAMTGTAGSPQDFLSGLQKLHDRYQATLDQHHANVAGGGAGLHPDALKAVQSHQANIESFLAHPDVQAAFQSAGANSARQAQLSELLGKYGLYAPHQMETRALAPYALTRMEGAQSIPVKAIPTERSYAARDALKGVGKAHKELIDAQKDHIKLMNAHGDAEAKVLQAERSVAKANQQESRSLGFVTGRYGQSRLQSQDLPKSATDRLNRNVVTTDNAAAVHQDLKSALTQARTDRKQFGLGTIAAKEDALKAAKEEFQQVHKPYLHEKNPGRLMVEDPTAPLIRAGKFKGQRLRPLSNDEIKAHMEANNVPHAAYVRSTLGRPPGFFSSKLRRGGSSGPAYTGSSTLSGAHDAGYGAIAKSQISSLRQILTAQMHDAFVNRFGIAAEDGHQFTDGNVAQAAHDFEQQHGVAVTPMYSRPKALSSEQTQAIDKLQSPQRVDGLVAKNSLEARKFDPNNPRGGNLVLVPTVQLQRYAQHLGTEPILKGKYLNLGSPSVMSGANRGFRNSVLPFSTKLFVMHGGENATRLGLRAGLAAPAKIPAAYHLAGKVTDRMQQLEDAGHVPQGSTARLQDLTAPGQHYGLQYNENLRHIEARSTETAHPATQYARAAADAYGQFAQGVFSIHRQIEQAGQKSMLGMHMQRQLQELSGTTLKAHTAISQYLDELAKGYADPKLAEDAARYVHAAGGQYNVFSPAMKYFIGRVAPFAPWYLNAAKFVYHTLPADHPAAAALAYSLARSNPGVSPTAVPHDTLFGVPTGTLLSDFPTGKDSYLDVGRFTPAGITDPKAWADMLFPALNSSARAVYGLDPFWKPFKGPNKEGTDLGSRAGYALNQLGESFGGPLATLGRVLEGQGSTQYNTSTLWHPETKPNTAKYGGGLIGGLARTFNPLQSVHLGGKKSTTLLPNAKLGSAGLGTAKLP